MSPELQPGTGIPKAFDGITAFHGKVAYLALAAQPALCFEGTKAETKLSNC